MPNIHGPKAALGSPSGGGADSKELAQTITRRQRAMKALDLYASGATWDQVADQLGYSDRSAAYKAAMKTLNSVENESVAEYRKAEDHHLRGIRRRLMTALARADDREVPKITAQLIALSARRGRLLGLDAPQQVEVSGGSNEEFHSVAAAYLIAMGRDVPRHIVSWAQLDLVNAQLAAFGIAPVSSLYDYAPGAVNRGPSVRELGGVGATTVDAEVVEDDDFPQASPAPHAAAALDDADDFPDVVPVTPAHDVLEDVAFPVNQTDADDDLAVGDEDRTIAAAQIAPPEQTSPNRPIDREQRFAEEIADNAAHLPEWHPLNTRAGWTTLATRH